MLIDLRVRDLGVIEDLTVTFGPGMTALTGETGAGKTLLVEALQLVLGGKASPTLVRAGAQEALVEARFVTTDTEDPAGPYEKEVVLSRSVPAHGRNRAWIDGRMAPVSALSERAVDLIDIHGQHEHHSLLSAAAQRALLDGFAGADTAPTATLRSEIRAIDAQLSALGGDLVARNREVDVLRHQVGEIAAARLSDPREDETLTAEEIRLSDLSAHREAATEALVILEGQGGAIGGGGVLDALGSASAALADREPFSDWEKRLQSTVAELSDVASDLRTVVEEWHDDPARLEEIQNRRHLLTDLRRKYGNTLEEVLNFADDAAKRLDTLERADSEAQQLSTARAEKVIALEKEEAILRQTRAAAAPQLAHAVQARLGDLAMGGARVGVNVADSGTGEPIVFTLGANPGEPLLPLAKVASGGELARTMLALRLVAIGGPATMVFDEVDAGVGGAAALALGQALAEVARERQVLVVTHLAQVAAFADQQWALRKETQDGRTVTRAVACEGESRVTELSRMLSGHPESEVARAHAAELLSQSQVAQTSTTNTEDVH
jgi:DNA repair protein RecN (Recombination protein N)